MNKLLVILILGISMAFIADEADRYRWDYKILIDTEGLKVFSKQAEQSSITELIKIPRPEQSELHNHRAEEEMRKVTITAYVVMDGKEEDGDYHLVLKSPTRKDSLIAEIPDPTQSKLSGFPALKDRYAKARSFVESNIDNSPGKIGISPHRIKVVITGVVFFDKRAHGKGHSANGVEIHPILSIKAAE